jgi:hypothetical protein
MVLRLVLTLLVVLPNARGAEREYMDAVGRLLGLSQSPHVIREYCAIRAPETEKQFHALLDAWSKRNRKTIERIDEALERADTFMRQRNAPSGSKSIAEVLASVTAQVRQHLDQQTLEEAISFCAGFPKLLEHKDAEFANEIPHLLDVVAAEEASVGKPR